MAKDADDREDHSREIAVSVAHEDFGGVPVVPPQGKRDADEGEEEVD